MSGLWERARTATERALASGALGPIETRLHAIEDRGASFDVREISSLAAKERAARSRPPAKDPFLPYEEALFVADAGPAHVLLLNKFPVVDDHLLLVTRAFEAQERLLSRADFDALFAAKGSDEALVFYNAGRDAGASEAHKHLQLVPVPLGAGPDAVPLEPAIRAGAFRFAHARGPCPNDPAQAHARYRALLAELGADESPYDLLMTSAWMLVVPRTRERFESISVNALGFAGSLLVRNGAELARVREVGPMAVLEHVSGRSAA